MGDYAVARGGAVLAALGLGSCVAVILHDPGAGVGGLAHVVLPSASLTRLRDKPARAAETAVPLLMAEMQIRGAEAARVTARLVGGASMFATLVSAGTVSMGERNVLAARAALRSAGIPVVGEAVGDRLGRSVWFDVRRGTVLVRAVGQEDHVI
jgi:chemotaxis protein CheD